MKKYTVSGLLTVSAYTVVEAETEKEAVAIAEEREVGSLCYGAISTPDDECWHFEGDGMPQEISAEEES